MTICIPSPEIQLLSTFSVFASYLCLFICTSIFIIVALFSFYLISFYHCWTIASFMYQISFIHQDISFLKIMSYMHSE